MKIYANWNIGWLSVCHKVIYPDEERKFNKDFTVGLIRSEVLNLAKYNVHMEKIIVAGRNKAATEFAISYLQTFVTDEYRVISELHNLVDALAKAPSQSTANREDYNNAEYVEPDRAGLREQEREGLVRILDTNLLANGGRRLSLCLVGKLLSKKLVNKEAFSNVMLSIWRVSEGVEIEWIEGNFFSFHFKNLEDRKRILSGSLWSFDRAMMILEEPVGDGDIKTMSFKKLEFWIQIHNIPPLCMTEEIGIFLGRMIGEVRGIDLEAAKEAGGRFIRARVIIDVNVPLMRSIIVDLIGNGKITTMLLRYERLLDYCFKCL
ncbi:hypothetical protein Dsin_004256 [Dipteronia sinensis]|uniref:DUF4283 domain-containing protein n=1 Tax=Dipteronia sinensis TaxID=43782 RepID=A0AAE0EMW7_9ROSI|nr:hypothetical protein Dsin_004256 [Dipteronia sinensis]